LTKDAIHIFYLSSFFVFVSAQFFPRLFDIQEMQGICWGHDRQHHSQPTLHFTAHRLRKYPYLFHTRFHGCL